jgi:hypothetical protein
VRRPGRLREVPSGEGGCRSRHRAKQELRWEAIPAATLPLDFSGCIDCFLGFELPFMMAYRVEVFAGSIALCSQGNAAGRAFLYVASSHYTPVS